MTGCAAIRPPVSAALRRTVLAAGLAVLALTAAGCASRTLDLSSVAIQAAPDANNNNAVAVDVVLISETEAGAQIAKLTAADWFRRRAQLRRDYPDGLSVLSWELAPGQSIAARVRRQVMDGYVFASYATPGDHRTRLTLEGSEARIMLQAGDFVVEGLKKAE